MMQSAFGLIVYSGKYTKTIGNAEHLTHFFYFRPTTKPHIAVKNGAKCTLAVKMTFTDLFFYAETTNFALEKR